MFCFFVQVFDCDFARDVVRYVHNGNPHLQSDRIRLAIRQFAAEHYGAPEVVSDYVVVTVYVTPPAFAIFIGELRPLVVDPRNSPALSVSIGHDVIQFRYLFFEKQQRTI